MGVILLRHVLQGRKAFEQLKQLESKGVKLQIAVNAPQTSTRDTAELAATGTTSSDNMEHFVFCFLVQYFLKSVIFYQTIVLKHSILVFKLRYRNVDVAVG